MLENKDKWNEFRDSGLLWWINRQLHLFGWGIYFDYDDTGLLCVRPEKVSFRGFSLESEDKGFKKLTAHLKENIKRLEDEVRE